MIHLRDLNNKLALLSDDEHEQYMNAINGETVQDICQFHNLAKAKVY